jgi:hypothetical protein
MYTTEQEKQHGLKLPNYSVSQRKHKENPEKKQNYVRSKE